MVKTVKRNKKRETVPGISEIASAIIVLAVLAVGTAVLVTAFYDRTEDVTGAIRERQDLSKLKAEELLVPTNISCNGNADPNEWFFILHNYAKNENTVISLNELVAYSLSPADGILTELDGTSITYHYFGDELSEPQAIELPPGSSVRVDVFTPCDGKIFLVTPAQKFLAIEVP